MNRCDSALSAFIELTSGRDSDIDLARAALHIAAPSYPNQDAEHYLAELDRIADDLSGQLPSTDNILSAIRIFNNGLYRENGFRGDDQNFYDPRNCHLNEVIDRRTGMPILLALVHYEVASRLGLRFDGVSFPGHFLIRHGKDPSPIVLDPFDSGQRLDEAQLLMWLKRGLDDDLQIDLEAILPRALQACTRREWLLRILRNLKGIYFHQKQFAKALDITRFIFAIDSDIAIELRDRGIIHEEMECARAAIEDYERYLLLSDERDDQIDIRQRLEGLRRQVSLLN